MLFVVSKAAGAALLSDPVPKLVASAFARLFNTYSDGHHVVLMEPVVCRAVEAGSTFSLEQKAAAKRIRNRFADYGGLPTLISEYATVVLEGVHPIKGPSGWQVPIQWIAQNPLSRSVVVGEDLHDTGVLVAAAEDYLETNGLRAFCIQATQTAGGGGNTHRVLERVAVTDQQVCLCVVDSDRHCPLSPPGPTALPCTEVKGEGLFAVALTIGRAMENALPWRLIDQVRAARAPAPSAELSTLEKKHPRTSTFLNMKRGMCGFDIAKLPSEQAKTYWSSASAAVLGTLTCCSEPCGVVESPLCRYKFHEGYGGSLLGDVATWMHSKSAAVRTKLYLPSPNNDEWTELGKRVSNFGLGLSPRRI